MAVTNSAVINRTGPSDQTIGLLGALGLLSQSPCPTHPTGSPARTAMAWLGTEAECELGM